MQSQYSATFIVPKYGCQNLYHSKMLLTAWSSLEFIIFISTVWEMLAITKAVSVSLQKVGIDLYAATSTINHVMSLFQEM